MIRLLFLAQSSILTGARKKKKKNVNKIRVFRNIYLAKYLADFLQIWYAKLDIKYINFIEISIP